jgi:hypothetical protein
MQEADAQGRLESLRGNDQSPATQQEHDTKASKSLDHERQVKKRRIGGEDDTDRDIRLATASNSLESTPMALSKPEASGLSNDAPIIDVRGHISLFPEKQPQRVDTKNAEAEAEKAKKKREFEDQYTMRFSNAAGFKQKLETPWYSSETAINTNEEEDGGKDVGKDVWGNEDRGRHSREKARLDANDPLAFMKNGVKQLRDVERDRQKWQKERAQELESLRHQEHFHRRKHRSDHEDVEDFSLDSLEQSSRQMGDKQPISKSRKRSRTQHSSDDLQEYFASKSHPRRHHRRDKHQSSISRSRQHSQAPDSDGTSIHNESRKDSRSRRHKSKFESFNGDPSHHKPVHSTDREAGLGWRPGRGGRYSDQFAAAT